MASRDEAPATAVPPASGQRTSRIVTLKRRAEFLRVRGGARWGTPGFALEAKLRTADGPCLYCGPRIGFTVTKKVGTAVVRNRIRRRLKEAAAKALAGHGRPDCDYVAVARQAALRRPFAQLVEDMRTALDRVNGRLAGRRSERDGQA